MENFEINDRFDQHFMDSKKTGISQWLRTECKELAHNIDANLPDCREKSISMSKLEEVLMWFNKGLARTD